MKRILFSLAAALLAGCWAQVNIEDEGRQKEHYSLPRNYRYQDSCIVITGDVAVVTAVFRKEVKK